MNQPCHLCQNIYEKKQDLSRNTNLIGVQYTENKEGKESLFIFFCTDCYSFLSIRINEDTPMEETIDWFQEEMNEKFIERLALALFANERKSFMEQRIKFLKNHLIPLYEPIDENEFYQIKQINANEINQSNVVKSPYVEKWCDNLEDCLNSFENEVDEEWDVSFSFSYADPLDLRYSSPNNKIPRYYRTYLVPADEVEPLLQIERESPNTLILWKQTVSRLEKIAIWDEEEGKIMEIEDFIKSVYEKDLWIEISEQEKEEYLASYKEWIDKELHPYPITQ